MIEFSKTLFSTAICGSKGQLYRHNYTCLISEELFTATQRVGSAFNKKHSKYAGLPFYYRGLITCATCGCHLTPERKKGYIYYHCTQYKGKHQAPYIREEELTKQLSRAFKRIQPNEEQYNQVIEQLKLSHDDKIKYQTRHLANLQSELSKIEKRSERLFDSYLDGDVDKEIYKDKTVEYKKQKEKIQEQIGSLDQATTAFYSNVEKIVQICRNAPETFASSKLQARRELLNLVLSNLELNDRQLGWKYKKPFDLMAFLC